ncbi:restriction endonuclease subunit S [Sellimonas intestinalis]|uniref:restriction endonuclease subunit S n=1 Tax=Sellimonas intestinalis TaxID=1653434 RepID=UPI003AB15C99
MSKLHEYKLNELYEMGSGISTKPEQAGHGAPFVSFSTIYNNAILPEELPDLMDTSKLEQEKYSVKEGDILLTRTSETLDELAMSSVAIKDYPNATFSGFAKRLRPIQNDITYSKFMAFFMRSNYFRKIVNCKAVMTLRASFNEEIFSYIKVALPEYEQQVKSGDLFWAIEQKIRNNNKINAELEAMAKTIYDYWFLQFEFPNEEGKPYKSSGGKMVWDDELKREIPEEWEVCKIGECIRHINTGLNPRNNFKLGNGNVKYITVKNLTVNGTIDFSDCDTIDEEARKIVHKRSDVSKGDILFASIAPLGRCVIVQENPTHWDINESVFCIRPDLNKLSSEFLYTFFMSNYFVKKAEHSSTGSVFNGIRVSTLEEMLILVPNQKIKDEFTNKVCGIFAKKYQNEKENEELVSLRDFFLPLLMNGQVGFKS